MTMPDIEIEDIPDTGPDIKPDFEPPPDDPNSPDNPSNWFNTEYPHSTPEHPYGFFPDTDGNPDFSRPRKRRPHKRRSGGSTGLSSTLASDRQARVAAGLLARLNALLGVGLSVYLPNTAIELARANKEFEEMAYQALLNDPDLCKRIMAAGTTSGKAQLAMAYALLGGALAPMAYAEVKTRRSETVQGERVA